jgi:hypothetical protein
VGKQNNSVNSLLVFVVGLKKKNKKKKHKKTIGERKGFENLTAYLKRKGILFVLSLIVHVVCFFLFKPLILLVVLF